MPAGTQAKQHVAALDVLVDGAPMDPKYRNLTRDVRVVDSLTLPDMAVIRIDSCQGLPMAKVCGCVASTVNNFRKCFGA